VRVAVCCSVSEYSVFGNAFGFQCMTIWNCAYIGRSFCSRSTRASTKCQVKFLRSHFYSDFLLQIEYRAEFSEILLTCVCVCEDGVMFPPYSGFDKVLGDEFSKSQLATILTKYNECKARV